MILLSWGANSHGQLAQGVISEACTIPTQVTIEDLDPACISAIVGGGGHTLLADQSGRVFATGWNNKGQLGVGGGDSLVFQLVKGLDGEKVTHLACGWDSSLAITQGGSLLVWGSNSFSQLGFPKQKFSYTQDPVRVPVKNVSGASFGLRHMAVLTLDGRLWVCGSGSKGQLGLLDKNGLPVSEVDVLTEVPGVDNVLSVACGQHHTVVLTRTGSILTWGDNRFGQLGLDSTVQPVSHTPQLVSAHQSKSVGAPQAVFAGWTYTVILTDKGEILIWGRNTYGQLGNNQPVSWSPALMSQVQHVKQVAPGSEHCTALTDSGAVLSWGWNEHGNCGNGGQENVWDPQPVFLKEGSQATLIGSGACHSFVILETAN